MLMDILIVALAICSLAISASLIVLLFGVRRAEKRRRKERNEGEQVVVRSLHPEGREDSPE